MMKRKFNQTDQPSAHGSGTDWQVLGEFELPCGANAHAMVKDWLSEALTPLHLHEGFLNKILNSAENSAARVIQTATVSEHLRTHFLIYIPVYRPANAQTWGFFRIEKVGIAAKNVIFRDHSVEFYLYLEEQ